MLADWVDIAKIVAATAALLSAGTGILAFVFGTGWLWRELSKPKLVYNILPTYSVGEQGFAGLVVENRGRSTAHNVLVKLFNTRSEIQALSIGSNGSWAILEGGQGTYGVTVQQDRIVSGSLLTLYILAKGYPSLKGTVSVTADEGKGAPVLPTLQISEPVFIVSCVLFGLCTWAVGLLAGFVILWVANQP